MSPGWAESRKAPSRFSRAVLTSAVAWEGAPPTGGARARGQWFKSTPRLGCGPPPPWTTQAILGIRQAMGKAIELSGQRFGRLTVLYLAPPGPDGRRRWLCACDCGAQYVARALTLRRGATRSCGCLQRESRKARGIDRTGQVYGRLTVLRLEGRAKGHRRWVCRCACGVEIVVHGGNLASGNSQSCGCIGRERPKSTRRARGGTFNSWNAMILRCYRPSQRCYPRYGGRGITVCDRWRESFEAFLADMGPRPSPQHSLDRFPNRDGNYEPSNCRWATAAEQARNKSTTVWIEYGGQRVSLSEAASLAGLSPVTVCWRRSHGWPASDWFLPVGASR